MNGVNALAPGGEGMTQLQKDKISVSQNLKRKLTTAKRAHEVEEPR